jgi:hypothetical protein
VRVTAEEYRRIDLRAHSLLSGVPLHDVWAVDLPGRGPGRTLVDLRALLAEQDLPEIHPLVSLLFGLRARLGRLLGWDRASHRVSEESFLHGLSTTDHESSLVPPGTREGPFRVLYVFPREALSEVRNSTVHAFSVFALLERQTGYRLYWAIYVRPVGRITTWYMCLIDPFRRAIIYPLVLRHIRKVWSRGDAAA